ncbi:MAG: GspE/PulE family protein [Bacteroidota bacterium]
MNTTQTHIKVEIIQLFQPEQAWNYQVVPFEKTDGQVHCYANTVDEQIALELEVVMGFPVVLNHLPEGELNELLTRYYRREQGRAKPKEAWQGHERDFLKSLISEAKQLGSSDIHLEPYELNCRLRLRIDGKLMERYVLEKAQYPSLVNKIKIQANLDIAEKRLPQDGRIFFKDDQGNQFDIRVSVLPSLHGEGIVMRLLSRDATHIDLDRLGFESNSLQDYLEGVRKPNGLVLISGPTGSGKTTTLYATLKELNKTTNKILTIEDPIEYTLPGINQVQLRENIGLNFGAALRTFLRQDPDVIMVGEIRDRDTAEMAIRASLTGHLVLSTIHTNTAWGIVSRLVDMGVPPFLLADTLNLAVAQRLVRKLCPSCKEKQLLKKHHLPKGYQLTNNIKEVWVAKGCSACFYTGYRGRTAVYEVIPMDRTLKYQIKQSVFEVHELLAERQIQQLDQHAAHLLQQGITSVDEVFPILSTAI